MGVVRRSAKAQSATEYLGTYGWAIMLVIIASAAILWLFVISPSRVTSYCLFDAGLKCHTYLLNNSGALLIDLDNQLGKPIEIIALKCTQESNAVLNASDTLLDRVRIPSGDHSILTNGTQLCYSLSQSGQTVVTTGNAGQAYKGKLYLKYRESDSGVEHVAVGDVLFTYEGVAEMPTALPTQSSTPAPTPASTPPPLPTMGPTPLPTPVTTIFISSCPYNITAPGSYEVSADLAYNTSGSGACITVQPAGGNSTLDCAGHSITGNCTYYGCNSGYGVYLDSTRNASVSNCFVYNYTYGILTYYTNWSSITSNTANNNDAGIYLQYSDNMTVSANTANTNRGDGMMAHDSVFGNYTGNTFNTNNNTGLLLCAGASYNNVSGNTISSTLLAQGLKLEDAGTQNNTLAGNTVCSSSASNDIYCPGGSLSSGTNTCDAVSCSGVTCPTACSEIITPITGCPYSVTIPGNYTLSGDLTYNTNGMNACIQFDSGSAGSTLDCGGHSITGNCTGSGCDSGIGIRMYAAQAVTVTNCVVSGFVNGIYAGYAGTYPTNDRFFNVTGNTLTGNANGLELVGDNATVRNNNVSNSFTTGIFVMAGKNATIANNTASNCGDYGIIVQDDTNTISSNIACSNGPDGYAEYIDLYCTATPNSGTGNTCGHNNCTGVTCTSTCGGTVVTGCPYSINSSGNYTISADLTSNGTCITVNPAGGNSTINGNGFQISNTGSGTTYAVLLNKPRNVTISNLKERNFTYGVKFDAANASTVSGCNFSSNTNTGVYLTNYARDNVIAGSTASNNSQFGIVLEATSNNNLTGNNVSQNVNYGIYVDTTQNNTISGNNVSFNVPTADGINIASSSNITITNNIALNNTYRGIRVYTTNRSTISGNTLLYNGYYGIVVSTTAYNNTVSGNTASFNGNSGTYDGIDVDGGTGTNVTGNTANSNTGNGVNICCNSHGSRVVGNNASNNTAFGIVIDASNYCTVLANNASLNKDGGVLAYASVTTNVTGNTMKLNLNYGFQSASAASNTNLSNNDMNANNHSTNDLSCSTLQFDSGNNTCRAQSGCNVTCTAGGIVISACPYTISSPGTYLLTSNLTTSATCISVTSGGSGATLDCQGHKITGTGAASSYGVYMDDADNTVVQNCFVERFEAGFGLGYGTGNIYTNNTAYNNTQYGFGTYMFSGNVFTSNNATKNGIYGFYLNYLSNSNNLTDNTASNSTQTGIFVDGSTGSRLIDNTCKFNTEYGIYLSNANNSYASANNATQNSITGIAVSTSNFNTVSSNIVENNTGNGITTYDADNNIIQNNSARFNGDTGIYMNYQNANNTISGNTLNNNLRGMMMESSGSNNVITGNSVNFNAEYGIQVYNTQNTNVTNNVIASSTGVGGGGYGIEISSGAHRTLVSGNNASNCTESTIQLLGGIENCTISGNRLTNTLGEGICLYSSSDRNNVTGNTITGATNYAIHLEASDLNLVSGNNVANNDNDGIIVSGGSINNVVTQNNLTGNGGASYNGIEIQDSPSNNFTYNNVSGSTQAGIYLYRSSATNDFSVITYNNLNGNGNSGIYVYQSKGNTIVNNTANANANSGIYINTANNNNVTNNTAKLNTGYGLYMSSSTIARITGNDFNQNNDSTNDLSCSALQFDGGSNQCRAQTGCNVTCTTPPVVISACPYTISSAGTYQRDSDLTYSTTGSNACITVAPGGAGAVVDCQAHSITGNCAGSSCDSGYGITVNGANVDVLNCVVKKFNRGIYMTTAATGSLVNNSAVNASHDGIFFDSDSSNLSNSNSSNCYSSGAYFPSTTGVIVSNFRAWGNNDGMNIWTTTGITLRNVDSSFNTATGIYVPGSTGLSLNNITANSNREGVLFYSGSNNNVLNGSTLNNNTQFGVRVTDSTGVTVANSTIKGNNDHGILYEGTSSNGMVSKNVVAFSTNDNVMLTGASTGLRVDNNTVYGSLTAHIGINFEGPTSSTASNNFVTNESGYGILSYAGGNNNLIENNTLSASASITVMNVNANRVNNNTISGCGWDCIWVVGSTNTNVTNNTALGANPGDGILFQGSTGGRATGNRIINSNRAALYFYDADSNTATNNTFYNNNAPGIWAGTGSDSNTISFNTILGNSDNGILIDGTSINNNLFNNTVQKNVGSGIYLNGVTGTVVTNNSLELNQNYGFLGGGAFSATLTSNEMNVNNHTTYDASCSNTVTDGGSNTCRAQTGCGMSCGVYTQYSTTNYTTDAALVTPSNGNDSSYSTYTYSGTNNSNASAYWNYSVGSLSAGTWQVQHGNNAVYNTTLPSACLTSPVKLRAWSYWLNSSTPNSITVHEEASTFASNSSSGGSITWNYPANSTSANNIYSTVTPASNGAFSYYLVATNFGFTIPPTATITGIRVAVERKPNAANRGNDKSIVLVRNGTIVGVSRANLTKWTLAEARYFYGGSSDLWGTSWTYGDWNSSTSGVAFSVVRNSTSAFTASVDYINMTVYYTTPGWTQNYQSDTMCYNGTGWQDIGTIDSGTSAGDGYIYEQNLYGSS